MESASALASAPNLGLSRSQRRSNVSQLTRIGLAEIYPGGSVVTCASAPFMNVLMYASTPELVTAPLKIRWPMAILNASDKCFVPLLGAVMGEMERVHKALKDYGRYEWFDGDNMLSIPYNSSLFPAAILFTPPPALVTATDGPTPLSLHLCHVFESNGPAVNDASTPYFQTVTRTVAGSGRAVRICSLIGLEFTCQTSKLAGTQTVFKGGRKTHEHNAGLVEFVHFDIGSPVLDGLQVALSSKGTAMVDSAIKSSMGVCSGCWRVFRSPKLKRCTACFSGAGYCSIECQKKHKKTHIPVCLHKRGNRDTNSGGVFLLLPLERDVGGRKWLLTHDGKISECADRIETAEQAMAAVRSVSSSENQAVLAEILESWK